MSLRKYLVKRDKFEYDESSVFCFPCTVCKYKKRCDTDLPRLRCDHNVNSERKEPR